MSGYSLSAIEVMEGRRELIQGLMVFLTSFVGLFLEESARPDMRC